MSRSASLPPTTRIGCSCICATPRIRIRRKTNSLMRWPRGGHPVVRIAFGSPKLLAQEFFRFEIATAVAGAVLGINPFDQPDVEASKVATREMTQAFEKTDAGRAAAVQSERHYALHRCAQRRVAAEVGRKRHA
jgi:hypothetical protein